MKKTIVLGALLCVALGGCGDDDAASDETGLTGAWYGDTFESTDSEYCLILCRNGRAFSGDRPCTDTSAPDFQSYLAYEVVDDELQFSSETKVVTIMRFKQNADELNLELVPSGELFPLHRVGPSEQALCVSSTAQLRSP